MGCGRNVGADMLSLALFCTAINQVLVQFCDEDQSGADLWVRVGAAIGFLSCYPERSLKQMKKDGFDLPPYGFRGKKCRLTYEQFVVAQNFLKNHKKRLLQTKKTLPRILDLRLATEQRRKAAGYCMKLFSDLHDNCLYYSYFPPIIGIPRGILKLLEGKSKKPKGGKK